MKILLKIKREPDGSHIDFGDKVYHFKPNEHGQHICEVEDKAHIKTLLGIDCYEVYDEATSAEAPLAPAPASNSPVAGSEGGSLDQGFEIQDELEEDGDENDQDDDNPGTDPANQDGNASDPAANTPAAVTREQLDEALSKLPGEHTDADYVVGAMRSFFGELFTADDAGVVRERVKAPANPAEDAKQDDAKESTTDRTLTAGQKAAQTRAANKAAKAEGAPASTKAKPNPALANKDAK